MQLGPGRISGRALRMLVAAVRNTPARHAFVRVIRADLGIDALGKLDESLRAPLPVDALPVRARAEHDKISLGLPLPRAREWPRSASVYAEAYRKGRAQPERVVARALSAAREFAAQQPSNGVLLALDEQRARLAARDSAARIAAGTARSSLEGVPVVIKEEVDVAGLPTRVGTGWMPMTPATADSLPVERLRAAGAIIVGTTPMTEYGLSPLGQNAHRAMPRNAHDSARLPGGSSSGSAVAVALGLAPVALGADGGGSIRVPAALNGVFGLKPTFGRVPCVGHGLGGGSTLVHLGPIGASAEDLALFLEATAGSDARDRASLAQPAPGGFSDALHRGVLSLRIGIPESEWAEVADDIAGPALEALDALEREGAELVRVELPLAPHAAAVGYLTIGLESFSTLRAERASHMNELGPDMQLLLATFESFRPDDYLDAQRLRAELRRQTAELLGDVDLIALPTTQRAAPPVTDEEARNGFIDPPMLAAMTRFSFLGNLTGLPAGTAPVGTNEDGLPVGLQLVGDAWDEATVLQALAHLERIGAARVSRPPGAVELF